MRPRKSILVVDDDLNVANLIMQFLEGRGYDVNGARDGNEAVSKALEQKPNLVLLDINLPGMDGLQVLNEIHLQLPETHIIMVSGLEEESVAREALEKGAYDYIAKPINLDHLEHHFLARLFPEEN